MAIVFKTPKSALNTTTKTIQNLGNGDCPPCPEVNLEAAELEYTQNGEYTVTPEQGVDGFSSIDVTVNIPSDVNNQNKTVNPSTSSQSVSADSGYSGLGTVTVNAVTSSIDNNISAGNIKKDVTILGVTGNYDPQPNLSNLNITPSINAQEYNPAISGVDGYSLVRVNAVTASIDSNIQAENILAGVTILGVEGSDEGYQVGYDAGVTDGEATGYQSGYDAGYADGEASCPAPTLGSLSVTPSTSAQSFDPADEGYEGFDSVSVSAVTAAIDNNITAGNIKNGVSILGVTGSYDPQPNLQSKSVNPTTSAQTVSPDSGYDGLSQVSVAAVTSAIDANIAAGNIKDGVTILGVTGNVVEASLWSEEFEADTTGVYTITPQGKWNGFDEVQVTVQSDPVGSFWAPFEASDDYIMADVYNKLDEGGYFDGVVAHFSMEVDSGSIDSRSGRYIAEDANGNSFAINPYYENPDYDPSLSPENQPDVPALIFPENFDLSGVSIQVIASFDYVTVDLNEPEDPNEVPTYTIEISDCDLDGINWNSDMESWPLYWNGGLSGDIAASTRTLQLTTNEEGRMSIASPEPWEIELDTPSVQQSASIMSKSGLRSAPESTLTVSQMSGDSGVFTLGVFSSEDQNTGFTVRGLNSGNELHINVNSMGDYFTIASLEDNNTIGIYHTTDSQTPVLYDFEYSLDGGETWISAVNRTIEVTLNTGDEMKLRSTGINDVLYYPNNAYEDFRFNSTGEVELVGNICSLLDPVNFINYQLVAPQTFYQTFAAKTIGGANPRTYLLKVTNASGLVLPSKLTKECFRHMFEGNTYLTDAPELPATYVLEHSYDSMFKGCTSLEMTPELPAAVVDAYAYANMFSGCESLINIPDVLPAKYLASHCYEYMFQNCTSLDTIPEGFLPATSIAEYCYRGMFSGTGVVEIPEGLLPANSRLAQYCYSSMFQNCTALEVVPEGLLPTLALSTGSGAPNCYSYMFSGCTSLVEVPEDLLPATTLYSKCYQGMFNGCTSLEKAPILRYYRAASGYYDVMFAGCTSLTEVTCLATEFGTGMNIGTNGWLGNVAASGTFYKDPNATWTLDSISGVPTGWTVEDYVEPSE